MTSPNRESYSVAELMGKQVYVSVTDAVMTALRIGSSYISPNTARWLCIVKDRDANGVLLQVQSPTIEQGDYIIYLPWGSILAVEPNAQPQP